MQARGHCYSTRDDVGLGGIGMDGWRTCKTHDQSIGLALCTGMESFDSRQAANRPTDHWPNEPACFSFLFFFPSSLLAPSLPVVSRKAGSTTDQLLLSC